jgi:hypothetical protein
MSANGYLIPDNYAYLTELAAPPPVENPEERHLYRHHSLEEALSRERYYQSHMNDIHNDNAIATGNGSQPVKTNHVHDVLSSTTTTSSHRAVGSRTVSRLQSVLRSVLVFILGFRKRMLCGLQLSCGSPCH